MIILLQGKDTYRQKEKIKELIREYNGAKITFFEFGSDNIAFESLIEESRQSSIFKEKKLIIVFNLLGQFASDKKVISFLNDFSTSENTVIVLVENQAVPKKQSLFKLFNRVEDIGPIKQDHLKEWIFNEINSRGGKIDTKAHKRLIDIIGNDLWSLSNEIDKLISYGKGKTITINDIDLLVKPKTESDIFRTIDFIAGKDRGSALQMIYSHLEKGDSVVYLFSMIGFQFRNLILIKNSDPYLIKEKDLGMHPFVFKKTSSQARYFSKEKLKKIYREIVVSDVGVKTGKIEPGVALDLIIFGI